ncbi:alkaline phosphatase [Citricoccus parietis]|uniref:Alkaline phosphatase n=1 Tax=Citricoccus parietis TaxID=592307 RepID=A0ABV6F9U3_9MICC
MRKNTLHRGAAGLLAAAVVAGAGMAPVHADQADEQSGPKNVIYMIGDGMGYNHVAATNFFETGQSQYQIDRNAETGETTAHEGEPVQVYEQDDFNLVGQTHYPVNSGYDPEKAWSDFDYVNHGVTDSAASGTAMATGQKTVNGRINLDADGNHLKTISEQAHEVGKSAGVVSSVQYNHATPASFAAHNIDRNNYLEIGTEMIDAEYLDVIMGAGHPMYDDNGEQRDPVYNHISEEDYQRVAGGETDWDFMDTQADFEALANGEVETDQVFGLAPVATTLQQAREGEGELPGEAPFNENVPDLPTMTEGALNVLGQDEDGFSVMIEGGAIDWTGHDNDSVRNIEETQDFNASVEAAVKWVEENSNWEETLLVVTADHETGYLSGVDSDPDFTSIAGETGQVPDQDWYSGNHTNHLVPVYFRGAGSEQIMERATGEDPVRGSYIDHTDVADLLINDFWATRDGEPSEGDIPVEAEVPGLPGEGEDPQEPGSLALSIAPGTAALGEQRNAGDRLRLSGELPALSVTDTRAEAEGWTVSGQSSELADGEATVEASYLGWSPHLIESTNGATVGERVQTQLSGGEGLAAPATLGSADAENRLGTTELSADLELELPVDTEAGSYQGAVSMSLFPVD